MSWSKWRLRWIVLIIVLTVVISLIWAICAPNEKMWTSTPITMMVILVTSMIFDDKANLAEDCSTAIIAAAGAYIIGILIAGGIYYLIDQVWLLI